MKLGSEDKKKVYALAVLGVVMLYMVYSTFFSGPSSTPAPVVKPTMADDAGLPIPPPPVAVAPAPLTSARTQVSRASKSDEFHPVLRSKRKEDQIDPFNVDPTLHLDLLAKVQDVQLDGGQRNLFQFGERVKEAAVLKGPEPTVAIKREFMGPPEFHPPPVVTAAAP